MSNVSVSKFFQQDHDRMDELFKSFQKHQSSDYARAREYFVQFKFGWKRHMVWEEQILLPILEKKAGTAAAAPIRVMKLEHKQIAEYLESIHQKVKAGGTNTGEEETRLLAVLALHSQNEENILFPALDRLLDSKELDALFETLRNVPEESYNQCCHH